MKRTTNQRITKSYLLILEEMKKLRKKTVCLIIATFSFAISFIPGQVMALPVIQEVFYDAAGGDATHVFTELYGIPDMNLDGWKLLGINGFNGSTYRTIQLAGAIIPDDGLLVIATLSAAGNVLAHRDFTANVDWQNGPDTVQLLNPLNIIIDALQYGDAGAKNAGEGTPALDVSAGRSLSRDAFGTDTNNNLADFVNLATPTPGVGPNANPVPEPTTLLLLSTGIAALYLQRRRQNQ